MRVWEIQVANHERASGEWRKTSLSWLEKQFRGKIDGSDCGTSEVYLRFPDVLGDDITTNLLLKSLRGMAK